MGRHSSSRSLRAHVTAQTPLALASIGCGPLHGGGTAHASSLSMYQVTQPALDTRTDAATEALWSTYRWMTLGLALTGLVALGVASSPTAIRLLLENRILFYGLLLVQLGIVVTFGGVATRASTPAVAAMFFAYAALTGVTFSTLFLLYTAASIGSVFLVTSAGFAGLSVVGFFTKRDLSAVGRFAIFALIGLIVASIVNLFLRSSSAQWLISIAGIVIFGALTAYDTQRLKRMFASGEVHANWPLVGALTLYLDFINLFLFLLRIFGRRR